jgi:hypothetical protein
MFVIIFAKIVCKLNDRVSKWALARVGIQRIQRRIAMEHIELFGQ